MRLRMEKVDLSVSVTFNRLMLIAAKSSLTILMKSRKQRHSLEKVWWRSVNQNITTNSPSNIMWNLSHFLSYCQKYCRSRREFLVELLSVNGLTQWGISQNMEEIQLSSSHVKRTFSWSAPTFSVLITETSFVTLSRCNSMFYWITQSIDIHTHFTTQHISTAHRWKLSLFHTFMARCPSELLWALAFPLVERTIFAGIKLKYTHLFSKIPDTMNNLEQFIAYIFSKIYFHLRN